MLLGGQKCKLLVSIFFAKDTEREGGWAEGGGKRDRQTDRQTETDRDCRCVLIRGKSRVNWADSDTKVKQPRTQRKTRSRRVSRSPLTAASSRRPNDHIYTLSDDSD